jgi:hypothetical protein
LFKERRNAGKVLSKHRLLEDKKALDDDDDDIDDNVDENEIDKTDESVTNIRERRFREFASIEYNGEIYMVAEFYLISL